MDLDLALEGGLGGEAPWVDGLDGGEVVAIVRDLLERGVTTAVAEPTVLGVDA